MEIMYKAVLNGCGVVYRLSWFSNLDFREDMMMPVADVTILPVEVLHKIFGLLSFEDIINCSLISPYWRWVLNSPFGLQLMTRKQSWTWLDLNLSKLLTCLTSTTCNSELTEVFSEAYKYRHTSNTLFHRFWSNFSLPTAIKSIDAVLLGPAIDTPNLSGGFLSLLFNSMDAAATAKLKSPLLKRTRIPGWSGQGIAVRIPMSGKNNASGYMIINLTTLHAKGKLDRASHLFGGSRIEGSLLIEEPTPSTPARLTPEAYQMVASTDLLLYAVDCRHSASDPQRWREIRLELLLIMNTLTANQTLIILGVGRKDNIESDLLSPLEIVKNLGGVEREPGLCQPLVASTVNWRVWRTYADNGQYTNISEILQWAFINVLLLRSRRTGEMSPPNSFGLSLRDFIPRWLLPSYLSQ
ncbi:hypothetical protein AAHC03_09947 [Spirometra sp. Aus1]|nr:unnamed protein product [Spirometra erinaceieuropaei]